MNWNDQPDTPRDPTVIRRGLSFAGFGIWLLVWSLYLADLHWRSSDELHTFMETIGTVLVALVGALALVRYYSEKNLTFFFVGLAFVATAFMDGYHTIVTSDYFLQQYALSFLRSGWSWFAERTYLAVLLWLSLLFWRRERRLGAAGKVSENSIYAIVIVLALVSVAIIELAPLPPPFRPADLIPRPQEFVTAAFFLLALYGYLRKGQWKTDPFEYWLVLSLIASFGGEAFFMAFARKTYDPMFVAAHLLELISYLCPVIGLLFSLARLFSESRAQKELAFKTTILATQQETSPDAIVVVDTRGKIVSHNRRFAAMVGLTDEVIEIGYVRPVLQALAQQTRDPRAFVERAKHLHAHATEKSTEETEFQDGRIFECYSAPMAGPDGAKFGRIWFYRDITARKHAEREVLALQEKLGAQALRDPLTGLNNRRFLAQAMPREFARAQRSGSQVGLIICDIDFFKKVNDTYGHLAGDEVLKVVGKLLGSHARGSDIVCRFGGEEFLLVLSEACAAVTCERAETIRRELQQMSILVGQSVIQITASFGIAMYPEHGTTLDELLRCADGAMYRAKTDGRNRVAMADAAPLRPAAASTAAT